MNLFELVGHIFMNSMVPILVLIGVGFILDRKFKLDLYTLSKLNFYILLPTFIFRLILCALCTHTKLHPFKCGR